MFLLRLIAVAVVLAAAAVLILERLPPEDRPFARIDLGRPVGLATRWQLGRLRDEGAECRTALAAAGVAVTPLPDRIDGDYCGFTNVVSVTRSGVRWSAPVSVTCAMAAALALWEREVVAPAAARHLGSAVVQIDHFGTYACRRVNTGGPASPSARASEHATANAIDIAGFRLADGRRIGVAADWNGAPARRAFLREVRDGSCRLFRTVLGPDYNAAHADHFHLDMGRATICR